MDRRLYSPISACVSAGPGGDRHTETGHSVDRLAPDFCLCALVGQSPGVKSSPDDGLVAKHRGFDQTPAVVARASLPAHASMLCDGPEVCVTLRGRRFNCNGGLLRSLRFGNI